MRVNRSLCFSLIKTLINFFSHAECATFKEATKLLAFSFQPLDSQKSLVPIHLSQRFSRDYRLHHCVRLRLLRLSTIPAHRFLVDSSIYFFKMMVIIIWFPRRNQVGHSNFPDSTVRLRKAERHKSRRIISYRVGDIRHDIGRSRNKPCDGAHHRNFRTRGNSSKFCRLG